MAVALEGQHGVDQVLEHPGPGQSPLLGDVADQQMAAVAAGLGHGRQLVGTAPHLGHRARRRVQLGVPHRLDGVDHHHVGLDLLDGGRIPGRDVSATSHRPGASGAEPLGPAPDLRRPTPRPRPAGTGPAGPASVGEDLQQQGRLADAGLAAEQGDRARHQPAAEHPVELVEASVGTGAPPSRRMSARSTGRTAVPLRPPPPGPAGRARARPPRPACSTPRTPGSARPAGRGGPALAAAVDGPGACHRRRPYEGGVTGRRTAPAETYGARRSGSELAAAQPPPDGPGTRRRSGASRTSTTTTATATPAPVDRRPRRRLRRSPHGRGSRCVAVAEIGSAGRATGVQLQLATRPAAALVLSSDVGRAGRASKEKGKSRSTAAASRRPSRQRLRV